MSDHVLDSMTYYVRAADSQGNLSPVRTVRTVPITFGARQMGKSWFQKLWLEEFRKNHPDAKILEIREHGFDKVWFDEMAEIDDQAWSQLNRKPGIKDDEMETLWYCQDGRVMRVSDMDLDHLINSWHMCAYMVGRMRHAGVTALGGLSNRNLAPATVEAFRNVQPSDVFPAYKEICATARQKFFDRFNAHLDEVKVLVFDAWSTGNAIPNGYETAVRWLLRDHDSIGMGMFRRRVVHDKAKLELMLRLARVESDEQLQRLAWNLRIDQKALWEQIVNSDLHRLIHRIPINRRNTALNFTAPVIDDGFGFGDDSDPFTIGFEYR